MKIARKSKKKWKVQVETQKDRLRKISISHETSQRNYKKLNEDMVKLERKFKYIGLRASLGLP